MKNLIAAVLVFVSFNAFGQNKFIGTWVSNDTTTFLFIKEVNGDLEFTNYDPGHDESFEEIVLRQLPNEINTTFYRPEANWSLDVTYHLHNENMLVADCFGSYYGQIIYTRL